MSNTTVGLVSIEAGCKSVVASPWPLDTRVPSYWLPAFLSAWESGKAVVDATFEANQAFKTRGPPVLPTRYRCSTRLARIFPP